MRRHRVVIVLAGAAAMWCAAPLAVTAATAAGAVARTGERQVLGSWLVPPHAHFGLPGHPNPLVIEGPSGIKINNLSHVVINVVNGRTLVSIPTPVTS